MTHPHILSVENLSIGFRQPDGSKRQIVKNVSFGIKPGAITGLVGESGSGKSICGYSILRLLPYPNAFHDSGRIVVDGVEVLNTDNVKDKTAIADHAHILHVRKNIAGMIFQEPLSALNPLHTAGQQLLECLFIINPQISHEAALHKAHTLLTDVELLNPEEIMCRYPHQLSGGQRQRLMIAMALSSDPKVLIADEPTTALDVTTQYHVMELLKNIQKRTQMAILFISHDLGVVKNLAEDILVLEHGKCVEHGSTKKVFSSPKHPYTKKLLDAQITGGRGTVNAKSPVIFTGKNIDLYYNKKGIFTSRKGHHALRNVNFTLKRGQTLGVVGESGSGKSSLAFAITRLVKSHGIATLITDENEIDLMTVARKDLRRIRQKIQIVFQDPFTSLNPRMTVGDIICEGGILHKLFTGDQHAKDTLHQALNDVGLDDSYAGRYPHELSGGQRQRVSIARSLILNPCVLILDEPTSALDRQVQKSVLALLRRLQDEKGLSYIFITHDLSVVRYMSHEVIIMKDGAICEAGATEKIFKNPTEKYTQELLKAALAMSL